MIHLISVAYVRVEGYHWGRVIVFGWPLCSVLKPLWSLKQAKGCLQFGKSRSGFAFPLNLL
ncbi:MAG: hypothetical protein JWN38_473 [Candidatus Saccharibacteria bacterium]|nr:hypothetical protein [Candidatus Saccharibacteria bacterium]